MGLVVKSTVIAGLLYGCECRTFSVVEVRRYQRFLNSIARYLCFKKLGGLRDMEGCPTMAELHKSLGWPTVAEMILARQLQYLGHLGRYDDGRPEIMILRASLSQLYTFEQTPKASIFMWSRLRAQIVMVLRAAEGPTEAADLDHEWRQLAAATSESGCTRDSRWMEVCAAILKQHRGQATAECWAERHAEHERLPEHHFVSWDPDSSLPLRRCGHCDIVLPVEYIGRHITACAARTGVPRLPARRRCLGCQSWVSSYKQHLAVCDLARPQPPAPGQADGPAPLAAGRPRSRLMLRQSRGRPRQLHLSPSPRSPSCRALRGRLGGWGPSRTY